MHKYEGIKDLPSNKFRRLTGVGKVVFQTMLTVIKTAARKRMERGGKPSHLNAEDKLLMTLEYLREDARNKRVQRRHGSRLYILP